MPFFTIVIPTRNRPELFELALKSVLEQSFTDLEVVVVNDGSDPQYIPDYKALEEKYTERVKFVYQIKRPNGHGQSYSMNTGALVGEGQYLGFLDDDDFWIDTSHLQTCFDCIEYHKGNVDVYYTDQVAYFSDGKKQTDSVWIEDLADKLTDKKADPTNSYHLTVDELMQSGGFAHLNCTIVRRDMYLDIKGMDENIRYECDRDIYLRCIDKAQHHFYQPKVTSQHHIPDPKNTNNMSTLVSVFEKRLYQMTVFDKAILLSKHDAIVRDSNKRLSDIYKHITSNLLDSGDIHKAKSFANKALACRYSLKWHVYCLSLSIKSWFG